MANLEQNYGFWHARLPNNRKQSNMLPSTQDFAAKMNSIMDGLTEADGDESSSDSDSDC